MLNSVCLLYIGLENAAKFSMKHGKKIEVQAYPARGSVTKLSSDD